MKFELSEQLVSEIVVYLKKHPMCEVEALVNKIITEVRDSQIKKQISDMKSEGLKNAAAP